MEFAGTTGLLLDAERAVTADARCKARRAGRWNGDAPAPPLPASVVDATSKRYLEAYRRITGTELTV